MSEEVKFTKAEAAGLWHAVEWMKLCLSQTVGATEAGLALEYEHLAAAKRALRKVQAARRERRKDRRHE